MTELIREMRNNPEKYIGKNSMMFYNICLDTIRELKSNQDAFKSIYVDNVRGEIIVACDKLIMGIELLDKYKEDDNINDTGNVYISKTNKIFSKYIAFANKVVYTVTGNGKRYKYVLNNISGKKAYSCINDVIYNEECIMIKICFNTGIFDEFKLNNIQVSNLKELVKSSNITLVIG